MRADRNGTGPRRQGTRLSRAAAEALQSLRRRGGGTDAALFASLTGASGCPAFLVAPDGAITAANPAGRKAHPGAGRAADLFGGADRDAALFRLGAAARRGGGASSLLECSDGTPVRVHVQSLSGGAQVWTLVPDSGLPAGADTALPVRAEIMVQGPDGRLDLSVEELPVALVRLTAEGRIVYANRAARKLLGGDPTVGENIADVLEGLAKTIPERLADTMAGKAQGRSEVARGRRFDGFLQLSMSRIQFDGTAGIIAVLSDATELKTLEAQFVQSQKMQAVGQLAGGVAHDFNNLLTAINGHCDLLLLRHVQGDGDHADLMQIRQNANRAASLVRQLLAFSRKQTLKPQVLNLYDTLAELANLLNRLLGERVELRIRNAEDIHPVRVDERQLEQVVVNLVVNARDAMPDGGVVTLRTRNLDLPEPFERDRAIVPPGSYSLIEVEDNGTGIQPDKLTKIFEPFYTTKRVGEGTGLGLSTAYGIIKQMDGFIFVDSTPGEGTTFTIYLPAFDGEADEPADTLRPVQEADFRDPTGRGVVLLVEDEAPVRAFASRALNLRGYTVIEAESGEAALELLEDPALSIDLIVSDVIMPGMDGPTWVRKAYEKQPHTSTVFVSGYSEEAFSDGKPAIPRSSYLSKPFTLNDLTQRVRDHLDRYPRPD